MSIKETGPRSGPSVPIGIDANGGRSYCLSCARRLGLTPGTTDLNGEAVQVITSEDEFAEEMWCAACEQQRKRTRLMPFRLLKRLPVSTT